MVALFAFRVRDKTHKTRKIPTKTRPFRAVLRLSSGSQAAVLCPKKAPYRTCAGDELAACALMEGGFRSLRTCPCATSSPDDLPAGRLHSSDVKIQVTVHMRGSTKSSRAVWQPGNPKPMLEQMAGVATQIGCELAFLMKPGDDGG